MRILQNTFIFTILLLVAVSACNKDTGQAANKTVVKNDSAVAWYGGYKMPELLAEPMKNAGVDDLNSIMTRKWYAEFNVYSGHVSGKATVLTNCADYLALQGPVINTVKKNENAAFMELAVMCRATKQILSATNPEHNYLMDIQFNKALPSQLPASVALVISESERKKLNADTSKKTWQDVYHITSVEEAGPNRAIYRHTGGIQELELVARGDFNGDKIEDLMISSRDSVEGGSYNAIRLFVVTRNTEGSEIRLISEIIR